MAQEFNVKKIIAGLVISLLLWLLVGSFLVTVTNVRYFSLLRELLVAAIVGLGIYQRLHTQRPFMVDDLERLIAWLFGLSLLSVLLITRDLGAWFFSARYSLEPLAVFWAVHGLAEPVAPQLQRVRWWSIAALSVTVVGFLMITVIPKSALIAIGYSPDVAVGNGQWQAAAKLPAFQTVAGRIPRLQGTLTGPIQFAGFALLLLFLLPAVKSSFSSGWYRVWYTVSLAGVIATFSRAAWIVLLIIGLAAGWRALRRQGWQKIELAALVIALSVIFTAVIGTQLFQPNAENRRELVAQIFTRDVSDREHVSSITDSFANFGTIWPLGYGFGRSGAGSIQNSNVNLAAPAPRFVDNSYLRWFEELGVIGFLVFSALIITLLLELKRQGDTLSASLALAGTGLAVTALFTDMWLEAVPVITFFALAGYAHQPPPTKSTTTKVKLLTTTVHALTFADTVQQITAWSRQLAPRQIITLNPEMAYQTTAKTYQATAKPLRDALAAADLVTADGIGIRLAGHFQNSRWPGQRWLYWLAAPGQWLYLVWLALFMPNKIRPIPERITGADLTAALVTDAAARKQKLALLGSTDAVLTAAKQNLRHRYPGVRLVFAETGPTVKEDGSISADALRQLSARLKAAKPHYLLVAFGVPKQELFIARYRRQLAVPVMIGVSGAFDSVLGQTVRRAPRFIQKLNLEWLWRVVLQPRRFNRIITAVIRFPWLITTSTDPR